MNNGRKGGTVYSFNKVNRSAIAILLDPMFWVRCGAAAFKAGEYGWSNSAVLIAEKIAVQELVIVKPAEALGVFAPFVKGLPARVVTASMYMEYFGQSTEYTFLMLFNDESKTWYPKGFLVSTSTGDEKFIHLV